MMSVLSERIRRLVESPEDCNRQIERLGKRLVCKRPRGHFGLHWAAFSEVVDFAWGDGRSVEESKCG